MAKVAVYELMKSEGGQVIGLGNCIEVEVEDAIEGIEEGIYCATDASLGVVPQSMLDLV